MTALNRQHDLKMASTTWSPSRRGLGGKYGAWLVSTRLAMDHDLNLHGERKQWGQPLAGIRLRLCRIVGDD